MTDKQDGTQAPSDVQVTQDQRPEDGARAPALGRPLAGLDLRFQQKSGGDDVPGGAKAEGDKRDGSANKPPRPSRGGEGGGNKAALPIKITGAQFLNNLMLAEEKKKAAEGATGKAEGAGGGG